jgi:hypothetical protein
MLGNQKSFAKPHFFLSKFVSPLFEDGQEPKKTNVRLTSKTMLPSNAHREDVLRHGSLTLSSSATF